MIIVGSRLGRWVVLSAGTPDRHGNKRWLCRCDCGTEKEVFQNGLLSGDSTQCGLCGRRASAPERSKQHITHGGSGSREYKIWTQMLQRCLNPNDKNFCFYGARGITVSAAWVGQNGFAAFMTEIGARPSRAHSVDRIDTLKGYAPGNVRWATSVEQARNTRSNRMIEYGGETQCLSVWAERTGLKRETIARRLNAGWSVEDALTVEVAP